MGRLSQLTATVFMFVLGLTVMLLSSQPTRGNGEPSSTYVLLLGAALTLAGALALSMAFLSYMVERGSR